MLARLYIIMSSQEDKDFEIVKNDLLQIDHRFSISTYRECPHLKDGSDFYATIDLKEEEVDQLLNLLNNDWDGEKDECCCYGFNTKMFNK